VNRVSRPCFAYAAGLAGLFVALSGGEAWAHHDLRQGLTDLLGPNAWAIYLIVPIPYVLFGLLGYGIYRRVQTSNALKSERKSKKERNERA